MDHKVSIAALACVTLAHSGTLNAADAAVTQIWAKVCALAHLAKRQKKAPVWL
jgi:hypothetical protein